MPLLSPRRLIAALLLAALCISPGRADDDPPGVAALRDLLANGLKCRKDEEFQFVDLVVARVEEGKLSRDMVKSIFIWARRKNSQFPFPYFQRAMRIIADRLEVDLGATLP
jgi:hypothetical protein